MSDKFERIPSFVMDSDHNLDRMRLAGISRSNSSHTMDDRMPSVIHQTSFPATSKFRPARGPTKDPFLPFSATRSRTLEAEKLQSTTLYRRSFTSSKIQPGPAAKRLGMPAIPILFPIPSSVDESTNETYRSSARPSIPDTSQQSTIRSGDTSGRVGTVRSKSSRQGTARLRVGAEKNLDLDATASIISTPSSINRSGRVAPLDLSVVGRRVPLTSRTARSPRTTVRANRTRPVLTERRTTRSKPLPTPEVSRALARAKVHRPPEAFRPRPVFQKTRGPQGDVQLVKPLKQPQVAASETREVLCFSSLNSLHCELALTVDPTAVVMPGASISGKVTILGETVVTGSARIYGGLGGIVIGRGCLLDDFSVVENRSDSEISIGDYVWIGIRAVLASPARVGNGAIIGPRGLMMENSSIGDFQKVPLGGVFPFCEPSSTGNSMEVTQRLMARLLRSYRI